MKSPALFQTCTTTVYTTTGQAKRSISFGSYTFCPPGDSSYLIFPSATSVLNVVAVTAKDRLSRFGASYLQRHLAFLGIDLIVLDGEREKGMMDELMDDFMALLASFSGRFYKMRSIEHEKLLLDRARERLEERVPVFPVGCRAGTRRVLPHRTGKVSPRR